MTAARAVIARNAGRIQAAWSAEPSTSALSRLRPPRAIAASGVAGRSMADGWAIVDMPESSARAMRDR